MHIRERKPGELKELKGRVRKEKDADRRDRLRAHQRGLGLELDDDPRFGPGGGCSARERSGDQVVAGSYVANRKDCRFPPVPPGCTKVQNRSQDPCIKQYS